MLKAQSLVAFVRHYADDVFNQFPIQNLFPVPELIGTDEFILPSVEELRTLDENWKSGPHEAKPLEVEKFTSRIAKALFAAQVYRIPSGVLYELIEAENLMGLGISTPMASVRQQQHAAKIAKGIARNILFLKRKYEILCIKILTNTTLNVNVDGVNVAIDDFCVNSAHYLTAAVSWKTGTTDIMAEWAAWELKAKQLMGGLPTHVILPPNFHADYLAVNDNRRDFYIRNSEVRTEEIGRQMSLQASGNTSHRFQVLESTDQYGARGSTTDMWTADHMVWIRNPAAALGAKTVATEDNDWNGGFFSYQDKKTNPIRSEVITNFNAFPYIEDDTLVMAIKLVP